MYCAVLSGNNSNLTGRKVQDVLTNVTNGDLTNGCHESDDLL